MYMAHVRIERGPGGLKNHKNIRFLSNTGPDPVKNYKATMPAFNVGPTSSNRAARDSLVHGASRLGMIKSHMLKSANYGTTAIF